MSIATVQKALVGHLKTLPNLPPLQEENMRNTSRSGEKFTRVTLLPAATRQLSVGVNGRDQLSGLLQVDIFTPMDTGIDYANELADAIIAHFPRGLSFTDTITTTHIQRAWRQVGGRVETFYQIPVVVQWSAII
jgi:hypothetical protein